MIRAIFFDMGGVLLPLHLDRCVEAYRSIAGFKDIGEYLDPCHQRGFFLDNEIGKYDRNGFIAECLKHCPQGTTADDIVRAHNQFFGTPAPDDVALVKELGQKYDIFLLSNNNALSMSLHIPNFEQAGLPLVQTFLGRMTRETKLMQYVLNMTELHMKPNMLVDCRSSVKSYMKMYDRSLCPEDLLLLARADNLGCAGPGSDREAMCAEYAQTEKQLRDMLALYYARMSRPFLMGRTLIEAGFTPGPLFAEALAGAHKLRLAGRPKEEQFKYALSLFRKESEKM
jgi:hypothetical protein